jgi:periplasmic protein TonB
MRLYLLFTLLLFAITCSAQDSSKPVSKKDTLKTSEIDIDDNVIFTKVEVEAEYPGGKEDWNKYLNKTLRYPEEAQNNEIQGTIIVQFIVDKEGNVSNAEAISGTKKGGLREESVRVIKLSGNWVPAVQNGRKVKSYKKVPMYFKISVEK